MSPPAAFISVQSNLAGLFAAILWPKIFLSVRFTLRFCNQSRTFGSTGPAVRIDPSRIALSLIPDHYVMTMLRQSRAQQQESEMRDTGRALLQSKPALEPDLPEPRSLLLMFAFCRCGSKEEPRTQAAACAGARGQLINVCPDVTIDKRTKRIASEPAGVKYRQWLVVAI